jgi:hypothetical protein
MSSFPSACSSGACSSSSTTSCGPNGCSAGTPGTGRVFNESSVPADLRAGDVIMARGQNGRMERQVVVSVGTAGNGTHGQSVAAEANTPIASNNTTHAPNGNPGSGEPQPAPVPLPDDPGATKDGAREVAGGEPKSGKPQPVLDEQQKETGIFSKEVELEGKKETHYYMKNETDDLLELTLKEVPDSGEPYLSLNPVHGDKGKKEPISVNLDQVETALAFFKNQLKKPGPTPEGDATDSLSAFGGTDVVKAWVAKWEKAIALEKDAKTLLAAENKWISKQRNLISAVGALTGNAGVASIVNGVAQIKSAITTGAAQKRLKEELNQRSADLHNRINANAENPLTLTTTEQATLRSMLAGKTDVKESAGVQEKITALQSSLSTDATNLNVAKAELAEAEKNAAAIQSAAPDMRNFLAQIGISSTNPTTRPLPAQELLKSKQSAVTEIQAQMTKREQELADLTAKKRHALNPVLSSLSSFEKARSEELSRESSVAAEETKADQEVASIKNKFANLHDVKIARLPKQYQICTGSACEYIPKTAEGLEKRLAAISGLRSTLAGVSEERRLLEKQHAQSNDADQTSEQRATPPPTTQSEKATTQQGNEAGITISADNANRPIVTNGNLKAPLSFGVDPNTGLAFAHAGSQRLEAEANKQVAEFYKNTPFNRIRNRGELSAAAIAANPEKPQIRARLVIQSNLDGCGPCRALKARLDGNSFRDKHADPNNPLAVQVRNGAVVYEEGHLQATSIPAIQTTYEYLNQNGEWVPGFSTAVEFGVIPSVPF